ncbi:MAG TPA: PEGA domain-containing protein [Bacteroidetes bacterium]|nr:PEGA domain-containing protein [Bacteroidota bacterium]
MEYRRILLVAVASLIFLAACCSNPTDNEADKGNLVALSDPDGAFIYIDGELQSNTTPAQFELDVATYIIKVAKLGYDVDPESVVVSIEKDTTINLLWKILHNFLMLQETQNIIPVWNKLFRS